VQERKMIVLCFASGSPAIGNGQHFNLSRRNLSLRQAERKKLNDEGKKGSEINCEGRIWWPRDVSWDTPDVADVSPSVSIRNTNCQPETIRHNSG
jgi:hypothetical protein